MDTQIKLQEPRITYKIEITQIMEREYLGEESILLAERHYTDTELDDYERRRPDMATYTKKVYGSKPTIEVKETKTKVYEQTITDLNIKAVIGAINGQS